MYFFDVIDEACTPKKGTKFSAAIDLFSRVDVTIPANGKRTNFIQLGVKLNDKNFKKVAKKLDISLSKFKKHFYIDLQPRSSIRAKGQLAGTGIIDLDFQDELCLILHNLTDEDFEIKKGDKVAQALLVSHKTNLLGYKTNAKRVGGFGSTN